MARQERRLESPYLPDEILSNILVRLPVKEILRFKTICKSWHDLLTSPDFINQHSHHRKDNLCSEDQARILASTDDFLYVANLDSPNSSLIRVNLEGLPIVDIVGSCNGLLLCVCEDDPRHKLTDQLVIVNPSTLVYRLVPRVKGRQTLYRNMHYGFGYDYVADDYKIVRIVNISSHKEVRVMVYNFRSDSWRSMNDETPSDSMPSKIRKYGALINNHLLHWSFVTFDNMCQTHSRLLCFDVCVERWSEVPLPDDCSHLRSKYPVKLYVSSVGVLDGCLCVRAQYFHGRYGFYGHPMLWVMKEYGVKESWVKFGYELNIDSPRSWLLPPISTESGREILCTTCDLYRAYKFFWYVIEENKTREVEIHDEPYHRRSSVCIRSLVNLCCYGRTDDQIKSTKIELGSNSVRRSARIQNKKSKSKRIS